jgi:hypothetical protein
MAGGVRVVEFAIVFILDLVHAAQCATITERLPLRLAHLIEALGFPELTGHCFGIMTGFVPGA